MNRFTALDINNELKKLVTALFYYDDSYIDDALRRYDVTQALHLYLVRNGYETVVFYSVAKGFHSYEKEMLERFFSEVGKEGGSSDTDRIVSDQISSPRRGGRLMNRMRRDVIVPPQQQTEINVSTPSSNIYLENHLWRSRNANNLANMQQFIYNLREREKIAIVVRADEVRSEFDERYLSELVEALMDVQNQSARGDVSTLTKRLIVMINSNHCRNMIMSLFSNYSQHPSVFLRGAFKSMFTEIPKDANSDEERRILNFNHSYVLPPPRANDVRNVIMLSRFESGMEKPVAWEDLDSICEQFSLNNSANAEELYKLMRKKEGYRYEDFASDGIKRVGSSEEQLESLIGLDNVKKVIKGLRDRMELAKARNEALAADGGDSNHLIFYGNPGTGKTTVARIIARIYKDLGFLKKGHLVEVSREHLCDQHIGGTAIKTQHVIDSALDGVLFIDEAYRLAYGGDKDFGKEAVDTILARMENDRHRLVVIMAGYEDDMQQLYKLNVGLRGRFSQPVVFPDYKSDELMRIFIKSITGKYEITPEVEQTAINAIRYGMSYKTRSNDPAYCFSNARWLRSLVAKIENNVAGRRTSPDPELSDISRLIASDFNIDSMIEMVGFVAGRTEVQEIKDDNGEIVDYIITDNQSITDLN